MTKNFFFLQVVMIQWQWCGPDVLVFDPRLARRNIINLTIKQPPALIANCLFSLLLFKQPTITPPCIPSLLLLLVVHHSRKIGFLN